MAVTYNYKGILSNKYTEGQITALNKDEAAFKLKEDKIIITSLIKLSGKEVKPKKEKELKKGKRAPKKLPTTEVIVFTKKFETIYWGNIDEVFESVSSDPVKGEYVIVVN